MKPLTTTNGTEELTRFLCIITAALYHKIKLTLQILHNLIKYDPHAEIPGGEP